MMDSTIKIVSILFFLVLISQGYGQCSLKDIHVTQFQPGGKVQGKPEWLVTITSMCSCAQSLSLNCTGFQTVEPIDPAVLKISGATCFVNGGGRIGANPVKFKYAWDQPFQLFPIHVEECS